MRTITLVIGFVALAAGLGGTFHFARQAEDSAAQAMRLENELRALRPQVAAAAEQHRRAQAALTAPENAGSTTTTNGKTPAPSTTPPLAAPASPRRQLTARSVIANDPKKLAEYSAAFRTSLDLTEGGLFSALGLSPEQIEKAKDMKVWREISLMELNAISEAEGLLINSPEQGKLQTDLEHARLRKAAALFDPAGLTERFNDLERLGYLRGTVERIASIEMGSETPATAAQVNQAVDIIAANAQREAPPRNPGKKNWQIYSWSWQDWAAINWDAAAPQLQAILLPAQYTALRQFMGTQEAYTAVAARNAAHQNEAAKLARQAKP